MIKEVNQEGHEKGVENICIWAYGFSTVVLGMHLSSRICSET